jgi:hypothetical protein
LLACEQILKGVGDEVKLFGFHDSDYKVKLPLGLCSAWFIQGFNHELYPCLAAVAICNQAVSQMRPSWQGLGTVKPDSADRFVPWRTIER